MKSRVLILILTVFFLSPALARSWERFEIPGAYCGNGETYSVFVNHKDADKLMVEFMAGGACWDELSCYSKAALADLHPLRGEPKDDLMMSEDPANPWAQHSILYFPYCTADVFSANHIATYKPGIQLYHYGYTNVILALQYLVQNNVIAFSGVQDLVVWGASAGALASFVHARNIEVLVSPTARKTLLSDSPGLHFGKSFWHKFSSQMNQDFSAHFGDAGFHYSLDDGLLAPLMGPVFMTYSSWKIGILQSTKDLVMSLVFGNITPEAHRNLVLGPQGIGEIAKSYPNVKTWIADVSMHTFLLRRFSGDFRSMQGETAWNFVVRTYTE